MTRYKTYQFPFGWMTYDTQTEEPPESGYIAGPFQVNLEEVELIKQGAVITLNDEGDDVIVSLPTIFDAEEGSLLP